MEARFEVRMENRKVMDKVRVLEMNMGQGGAGIRVPVQCCTECNRLEEIGGLPRSAIVLLRTGYA